MRRLIALAASALILAILWHFADHRAILAALRSAEPLRLSAAILLLVPLTLVTAWRFKLLSRTPVSVATSLRLLLAAATLNLVLPSKIGDLTKAWVLHRRYGFTGESALTLVIFEKAIDLAALLLCGLAAMATTESELVRILAVVIGLGLLAVTVCLGPWGMLPAIVARIARFLPGRAQAQAAAFALQWQATARWFWHDAPRALATVGVSLALWCGHLVQIWLLATSLDAGVPLLPAMSAATVAILAGLLPFTVAGLGTRDAALMIMFAPWLPPAAGAALGVLASLRYLLPALAGLPFLSEYWRARRQAAAA